MVRLPETLAKKNPGNIIFHIGTNDLVNETSRDVLNAILSSKNFIEKLCPTYKITVYNIICRLDTRKASLNVKTVNDQLDALKSDSHLP